MMVNPFEKCLKQKIYRDRCVLEKDYSPNELLYRENQISQLVDLLFPAMSGGLPSDIVVYGDSGSGKTVVVCKVLTYLSDATSRKVGRKVRVHYLNCTYADTELRVYETLLRGLGCSSVLGLHTGVAFRKVVSALDELNCLNIVVLDEIDKLVKKDNDDSLYGLTRINSDLKKSKVCLIVISNDSTFKMKLDSRVLSSFGAVDINFPSYTISQLVDILNSRSKVAFFEGAVSDDVIPLITAIVGRDSGDARKAIDLLRYSADIAAGSGASVVTSDCVDEAKRSLECDVVKAVIGSMSIQRKTVYRAIRSVSKALDKVTLVNVYDEYCNLCRDEGLTVLTYVRVWMIVNSFETAGIVHVQTRSNGRHGRSSVITLVSDVDV